MSKSPDLQTTPVDGCTSCPLAHDIYDSTPTCGHPDHGPASALLHGLVTGDEQEGVMVPDYVPDGCPLLDGPLVIELATTRKVNFAPTVKVGDVY